MLSMRLLYMGFSALFSLSSLGELEADAITLLKRIRKFSMAQDIGARAAIHIFNRISFAIAKGFLNKSGLGHNNNNNNNNNKCAAKYMDKCAAIGYGFLPFSFSSGELELICYAY
ncbi:hypothetical protein Tco_1263848 [Tanacetum coccineum]